MNFKLIYDLVNSILRPALCARHKEDNSCKSLIKLAEKIFDPEFRFSKRLRKGLRSVRSEKFR